MDLSEIDDTEIALKKLQDAITKTINEFKHANSIQSELQRLGRLINKLNRYNLKDINPQIKIWLKESAKESTDILNDIFMRNGYQDDNKAITKERLNSTSSLYIL